MKRILFFIFLFIFLYSPLLLISSNIEATGEKKVFLSLFWGEGCPHCEKEKKFLSKLKEKYSFLVINQYEIWKNKENLDHLKTLSKKLEIKSISVPITIIQEKRFVLGFFNEETTGKEIENIVLQEYRKLANQSHLKKDDLEPTLDYVSLPFFGEIEIKSFSLPLLTIILGAIDGFNPCALWVLIMLLSFLIATKDKKKLIILGSIFIFSSAFVYFLFMVAWLNLIIFIGYMTIVKIIIGSIAIIGGLYYIKEFFTNKEGVCKVTSIEQKKKISEKISTYISKKNFWIACIAIFFLAFLVNLIELICSAGIPAIYIQILAMSSLSSLQYYLYILLYILVFLLDNLIIFFIAIFTFKLVGFTNSYSRYCHIIGGIILVILGTLLIFKSQWLMFG